MEFIDDSGVPNFSDRMRQGSFVHIACCAVHLNLTIPVNSFVVANGVRQKQQDGLYNIRVRIRGNVHGPSWVVRPFVRVQIRPAHGDLHDGELG